ncbi:MAG TPA: PP2C family protein-serine/threonine phosphatase, partial [Spirochaetales bacterium]|nr:PP2C family protein-serine/threonine phosphatase [Spirochaetales bacterium]
VLVYRRASDSIESLELKSVPIGVERTTEYGRKALRLSDGDIVVLYTDGIIEAMNEQGKQYGRRGLSQVVTRNRDLAPKEIVAKIKSDLSAFVGSVRQHDDQTVLVLKMKL